MTRSSLSLFFGVIFLLALVGQAFAGWQALNAELYAESLPTLSLGEYATSADFMVDVSENWQSEYLQFTLFILVTVWLVQEGSPESKPLHKSGLESDEDQKLGPHLVPDSPASAKAGGWRTASYSWSLTVVMVAIFVASWLLQGLSGWLAFNESRMQQLQDPLGWWSYLANADFWNRTLQNWQSEFLAVGSMAVLAIYLRQRGSPESKPVGEPHTSTGVEG